MKLGLTKGEVKLVPYTSEWKTEFINIKKEIVHATGANDNRIEHIGSTAITNMVAKPIIDILIGVDDLTTVNAVFFKNLQKVGFLRLRVERQEEIVLAKFTDDSYEVKTHYIHLVDFSKDLWNNFIYFRDYLNGNEDMREEYKKLKIALADRKGMQIMEYTDLKEPFVKSIYATRKS